MTAIQKDQPEITENNKMNITNASDSSNNNLLLPEMASFDEATPLSPLASLERCVSNPLVRGYSNVSVSSDNEGAHFVPFGRGHNDIANPNGSSSNIDLTQFGFSPNITGFNINDPSFITNDDTVNCITPIASLLEKNRIPIPPQQTILAPLEDQDTDFDIDARTDRTGTTSSQLASSQDDVNNDVNNKGGGGAFNVDAVEFIPSFQPPPSLADNQMINIPPARDQNGGQMMMPPPLLQAVPVGAGPNNMNPMMMPPPPHQMMMGLPPPMPMNMNNMNNMMQRPQMNINVDMPPMPMDPNTVQGSPQQHIQRQQQQQQTPNTPQQQGPPGRYRKNSGGSFDGIVRNYMDATGRERDGAMNQSHSPDVNGSRSPINDAYDNNGYGQQQQQQQGQQQEKYRWGDIRQQKQGQAQRGGGGGQKYVVKTGQGQQGRQGQGGGGGANIANMEITDIIRMNVALPALLENRMICKFMKHQNGSRYIQERLKNASHDLTMRILRHIIFEEKQILSLSKDIFGNYVIQIFFENGSKVQHQLLIENLLYHNVYDLSISFYGCRVIQKAFDCISQNESKKLILELEEEAQRQQDGNAGDEDVKPRDTHNLIINPNANHVIQKIITLELPIKHIQFIIDCIDANIGFYSGHIFGCRIVQNIINYYGYHDNKRMLKEMVSKDNLLHLCQSQYGNYVIQHILKLSFFDGRDKCLDIKQQVIKNVFGNVLYLSKNKYGSNVVEHCLEFANDKQKDYFLDQILNKKSKQILCEMVKHKYANYVIQKLLTYCNMKQKQRLIHHIERNVPNLRTLNYGKHIMDKIKKIKQQTGYNHNEQQQQYQQNQNQKKYYNNY